MPIKFVRNDITKMEVDVIVNSANPNFTVGPGIDAAICYAAGLKNVLSERKEKFYHLSPGEVGITKAYSLKAKYIFHTVGPLSRKSNKNALTTLKECYAQCLQFALDKDCHSIAFPLIATGRLKVNYSIAVDVAHETCLSFFKETKDNMDIYIVFFGDEIEDYLKYKNYSFKKVTNSKDERRIIKESDRIVKGDMPAIVSSSNTTDIDLEKVKLYDSQKKKYMETFNKYYSRFSGIPDSVLYNRVNMSPSSFSSAKSCQNIKTPQFDTLVYISFAFELNYDESIDLFESAGYKVDISIKRNNIIFMGLKNGKSIFDVNYELYDKGEQTIWKESGAKLKNTK